MRGGRLRLVSTQVIYRCASILGKEPLIDTLKRAEAGMTECEAMKLRPCRVCSSDGGIATMHHILQ